MSGLREWGAADLPPALLLHCTLAHGGAWTRLARRLSDRFRLIAPDMVAHGGGPAADPARDLHDQSTEHAAGCLPGRSVHLVGHSFGATVALRLAIEHPARVRTLALIEPVLFAAAPDGPERRANAETLARMGPMIRSGRRREAARLFLSVWGAGGDFDDLPPEQAAYMAERIGVIEAQRAALHDDAAGLLTRLGAVECPVLLLEGTASPPVIGAIQTRLAAGLRDARRAAIPGAGHMAPVTHAAEVAEALGGFWSEGLPGEGAGA
jgi:pimeloyl-ACP methyl ester carboxylesterase